MILKFEKRSFWRVSLKILSFTITSAPEKSEKRNRKTNKFRKACGSAIFENWHLLFTLKVVCWWFAGLVNSFTTNLHFLLQPTNTQILERKERDGEAIKRRLKILQTKTLKRKNNTVTGNCSTYLNNYKKFAVCFFEILQTLNYGFKKYLNNCL